MLRQGLASIPTPKNEFEIVVPDDEGADNQPMDQSEFVEDQSDLDNQQYERVKAERE